MKIQTIIIIIAILLGLLFASIKLNSFLYSEFKTYKQDINNILTDKARELTLSNAEMKKAFDKRTHDIIDSVGIKDKQVDHYTQVDYKLHTKDTTVIKTVYDSIKNTKNFIAKLNCFTVDGSIFPGADSVGLNNISNHDTIDLFDYHGWDKHFWFIKWKRYQVYGAYSRCKGDTLAVLKNYKRKK